MIFPLFKKNVSASSKEKKVQEEKINNKKIAQEGENCPIHRIAPCLRRPRAIIAKKS